MEAVSLRKTLEIASDIYKFLENVSTWNGNDKSSFHKNNNNNSMHAKDAYMKI